MTDDKWFNGFLNTLEQNKTLISHHDFKFYNIARLPLVAKKVNEYSKSCEKCEEYKNSILHLVQKIKQYLGTSIKNRKYFEQKLNEIKSHLKKNHDIHFASYFSYTYTFIGFITGLALCTAISYIVWKTFKTNIILSGTIIFIVIGRIYGYFIDRKKKKSNKQI